MSGMWNRTLVYLGLREEPEDGYEDLPERYPGDAEGDTAARRPATEGNGRQESSGRTDPVSRAEPRSDARPTPREPRAGGDSNVRPLRTGDVHVRAVPPTPLTRTAVIEVHEFEDVEAIGARYRTGQPVIFDVSGADAGTGRRALDFVSGLTFALRGKLVKVAARAFLILPDGVELPAEERRRLDDLGYRLPAGSDA